MKEIRYMYKILVTKIIQLYTKLIITNNSQNPFSKDRYKKLIAYTENRL